MVKRISFKSCTRSINVLKLQTMYAEKYFNRYEYMYKHKTYCNSVHKDSRKKEQFDPQIAEKNKNLKKPEQNFTGSY